MFGNDLEFENFKIARLIDGIEAKTADCFRKIEFPIGLEAMGEGAEVGVIIRVEEAAGIPEEAGGGGDGSGEFHDDAESTVDGEAGKNEMGGAVGVPSAWPQFLEL